MFLKNRNDVTFILSVKSSPEGTRYVDDSPLISEFEDFTFKLPVKNSEEFKKVDPKFSSTQFSKIFKEDLICFILMEAQKTLKNDLYCEMIYVLLSGEKILEIFFTSLKQSSEIVFSSISKDKFI